jgi:indoleamine 2,3-dioxygenase
VLDNWGRFDTDKGITLDNIYMLQHFLGGQDEAWFVLIHVAIEAQAGSALALMGPIVECVKNDDLEGIQKHLEEMGQDKCDFRPHARTL